MDPITAAGTFATLVGLLGNFRAERSGQQLSDFIVWLREHHQDQIVSRIETDQRLTSELKVLLARSQADLSLKLKALDEQLSRVAQQIEGLGSLAKYLAPASPLSTQALNVLRQLVVSGADFAIEVQSDWETQYVLAGGRGGNLEIAEPKFINEDVEALATVGLLRIEATPQGSNKIIPTRLGYQYSDA